MNDSNKIPGDFAVDLPTDLSSLVWVPDPMGTVIEARDHSWGQAVQRADIRLFWDDPPWSSSDPANSDQWAVAAASEGIAVAGLRREVALPGGGSRWIDESELPRILPYRNERFGIQAADFERANFIDVRLNPYLGSDGRAVYRQEFLNRMGVETASKEVASMTLPPEVTSVKHLKRTVEGLRAFAPESTRLLASVSAVNLAIDLPRLVSLGFDGFVLRADDSAFAGVPLAYIVKQFRTQLDAAGFPETILWVVPPAISADDMAKLIALGADAIACDHWCDPLLWTPLDSSSTASQSQGVHLATLRSEVGRQIDRVHGLVGQAMLRKSKTVLATTSPVVSRSLGLGLLGGSRRSGPARAKPNA